MSEEFRRAAPAPEPITDYRTRLALEQNYALERRRQQLAEQTSTTNTPERRIALWEQSHALTLPTDPAHTLLAVIARDTGLALEQVQDEQKQRSAASATRKDTKAGKIWDPYCTIPGNLRQPKP